MNISAHSFVPTGDSRFELLSSQAGKLVRKRNGAADQDMICILSYSTVNTVAGRANSFSDISCTSTPVYMP